MPLLPVLLLAGAIAAAAGLAWSLAAGSGSCLSIRDNPRSVLQEAKSLTEDYPAAEVERYAARPAGAKRGFELLRHGIPYEFGEFLV